MDDFNINTLRECTNELCVRLVNILTPLIIQGTKSIFEEAWKMCSENKQKAKYLMTFQQLLSCIPKWNAAVIQTETDRIVEKSRCGYLEDLISCVHIIQLKTLTAIRVGNKQKKIDISIPKLADFIHNVYIHVARELYTNVYLFERDITALDVQKNMDKFKGIVDKCILDAVRDSIPTEQIIRAYMDESVEIEEEVVVEKLTEEEAKQKGCLKDDAVAAAPKERTTEDIPVEKSTIPLIENRDDKPAITRIEPSTTDALAMFDDILPPAAAPTPATQDMDLSMLVSKVDATSAAALAPVDDDKIQIMTDAPDFSLGAEIESLDALLPPLPREKSDSIDLSNEIISL